MRLNSFVRWKREACVFSNQSCNENGKNVLWGEKGIKLRQLHGRKPEKEGVRHSLFVHV